LTNVLAEILPWDTKFFGFPVARVWGERLTEEQANQIDAWCEEQSVQCLYFLCELDDFTTTSTAERSGFHYVDIRMTLDTNLSTLTKDRPTELSVRPAQPQDIGVLQKIAAQVYRDTRFTYDPHFPPHLATSLYETWIKVSCEGYADTVLVAEEQGVPIGYITCHLEAELHHGRIGLVGVDRHARGKGVGRVLVTSALAWFQNHQMLTASVVTQGRNYAAQRLYQRCGFRTQSIKLWYHKWYEKKVNYD
jgi:dTDP-4-amino-4,6-dideoxy-D-galactose acyltransferase